MKNKMKVSLIGLLKVVGMILFTGLVFTACMEMCPGNAECTITIRQGTAGLYVDTSAPLSSCGSVGTWNQSTSSISGGCRVENMRRGYNMRYGTWGCSC